MSVRTYNLLKRNGINTLADLVARSESDLLALPNFSERALADVMQELRFRGMSLHE